MKRLVFVPVLLLAASALDAAPQQAGVPLVPRWQRVTLENGRCKVDMPGPINVRQFERLDHADVSGTFSAEGVSGTKASSLGMFVVISAVTTKFTGKPKDLRRFVDLLSVLVEGLLHKEFSKSLLLQEERPVVSRHGSGTDYIYRTPGTRFAVRLRKLTLEDRAYFLIGVGAPADVRRFVESLEPLPAGGR